MIQEFLKSLQKLDPSFKIISNEIGGWVRIENDPNHLEEYYSFVLNDQKYGNIAIHNPGKSMDYWTSIPVEQIIECIESSFHAKMINFNKHSFINWFILSLSAEEELEYHMELS